MIISKLSGGLGNQMFQFAAAKALSLKHRTELKIDATNFKIEKEGLTPRDFELSIFEKEPLQFLTEQTKKKLLSEKLSLLSKIQNKITGKKPVEYYRERGFHFNKEFFTIPNDRYLIGYFQSEKYFKNFEKEIRGSFEFPTKINEKNQKLRSEILNCNSVSVHVRRGDYVKVASNLKHHGVCSLEYYQNAIERICKKIENPVFYFFSDDIDWVKSQIKSEYPMHYIAHNTGNQSFEDMRLMSHCKHHIIANSSFSWWGAWLNPNSEKMVIAPTPWFGDPKKEKEATDLVPENWIRIQK